MRCPVLLLLLAAACTQADVREEEETNPFQAIAAGLAGDAQHVIDYVVAHVDLDAGQRAELRADIAREAAEPEEYVTCAECRAIVSLLLGLVNQGLGFDAVRDQIVDICIENAPSFDTNGEVLCPGIVDLQGPHLYYILNETDYSARELCQLNNVCPLNNRTAPGYTYTRVPSNKAAPAVRRKLDEGTVKILALSDIHIDEDYMTGAATDCGLPVCCKDYFNGTGSARPWGEGGCNIPPRTLVHMLQSLEDQDPDFIIYSGDSPPHMVWNETMASQLKRSQFVAETLADIFPGVPAFAAIGNHELYPTNLYFPPLEETQYFSREFASYWREVGDLGDEQVESLIRNGYYSMELRRGLRLVTYNSNYVYTENFYNILSIEEKSDWLTDMKSFLEDELQKARENGEKVILLGHHPTGSSSTYVVIGRLMVDILLEYGDVIVLHSLGHHHNDFFRLVIDSETGLARAVQMANPTGGSRSNKNPSARFFYLDEETFAPLDYENYYLDLAETMLNDDPPELKFMYRASEEYGIADFTAQSLQELTDRFEEDQELFERYVWNRATRAGSPRECDGACKAQYLCEARTSAYDLYQDCLSQQLL
jgi:sphingomyelin phosphodiesterase